MSIEMVIMRGVAGSGKSTYAKRWVQSGLDRVRISRDDIRLTMFGTMHGPGVDEDAVTDIEHAMIRAALGAGKSVVVDDCNVTPRWAKAIANIGFQYGAEVRVEQVDVSLETAKAQNDFRAAGGGRSVPHDVIERMYNALKKNPTLDFDSPVIEPYVADTNLEPAFLFDVDGTLAKMQGRNPYDYSRVSEDAIVEAVREVSIALAFQNTTVVMSGRDDSSYKDTLSWLFQHDIPVDHLFMRKAGDKRPDTIVKYDLFNEFVRDRFNVIGVVDDRPSVCRMWRTLGVFTFQVGDPHKEF